MKRNRFIYTILVVTTLFIFSCNHKPDKIADTTKHPTITTIVRDSAYIDSMLYDKIDSIAEVKMLISQKTRDNVAIMIRERPDSAFKYYWVQVGIDESCRFRPMLNFYIIPDNFNVLYLNTMANDSVITLEQWRKSKYHW